MKSGNIDPATSSFLACSQAMVPVVRSPSTKWASAPSSVSSRDNFCGSWAQRQPFWWCWREWLCQCSPSFI